MKRASEYSKMAVSYRKLRHILIDRGMKKKDLEEAAGIIGRVLKENPQ